jgi:UDP-N-acetylglucosamine 2-epimerase (non-hydrolysing)
MYKNLVIFGTRPEAVKLFPVINALSQYPDMLTEVLISGQHRHMLDQVLSVADIVPDYDLNLMRPGQSLDAITARLLQKIGKVLDRAQPDRVIVQGDTVTAKAGALTAYYRKIPVSHVEAGLRSHDIYQPWPEEVNRKVISSIAHQHFAATELSAAALRAETIPTEDIYVTGNTVIDALHWVLKRIVDDPSLILDLAPLEARSRGRKIICITAHRRENFGLGMVNIAAAIKIIAARDDVACIFPVHLNPEVRAIMHPALGDLPNVAMIEPLDYPCFAQLLSISHIVLTDSGGVQEEASALGKPVLILREITERPESVATGIAKLVGTDTQRIVSEISTLLDDDVAYAAMAHGRYMYGDGHASQRIAKIISNAR